MSTTDIEESAFPAAPILAVDDHPANLLALSALLEPLGCPLATANSGPEALELAVDRRVRRWILLDVMMPGMDGFETFGEATRHAQAQHVPVIFVTTYRARRARHGTGAGDGDGRLHPEADCPRASPQQSSGIRVAVPAARVPVGAGGKLWPPRTGNIAMLAPQSRESALTAVATSAGLLLRADLDPLIPQDRRAYFPGHRADERDDPQPDGLRARGARHHPDRARERWTSADSAARWHDELPRSATPEHRMDLGCGGQLHGEVGSQTASIRRSQTCSANALRHGAATSPFCAQGDDHRCRGCLSTMAVQPNLTELSARDLSAFRARRAGSGGPGPRPIRRSRDHEGSPGRGLGDLLRREWNHLLLAASASPLARSGRPRLRPDSPPLRVTRAQLHA